MASPRVSTILLVSTRIRCFALLALLASALGLVSWPALTIQAAAPNQSLLPTATAIPPGDAPDRCEPNDSLVQPCAMPTEIETADLTFVDDAIDIYSVLLKANRSYTIRASSTSGIDPVISVFLAGATDQPIAQNDDLAAGSSDAAVQVTTSADGWYLIQVENQASGDMRGRTYRLSVRSSTPQGGSSTISTNPTAIPQPAPPGDAFENNWRVEDAPHLAWDVPYDLSLICPETRVGACPSGDHDFFLVAAKAGIPFAALTYDLGPGADTTLAIYRPAPGEIDAGTGLSGWKLAQGNDDALRGRTLRSQVILTPDWDGEALLIVAPSNRSDPPRVPDAIGPSGRYRLMVGSPFLPGVSQALGAQQESAVFAPSSGGNGGNTASGSNLPAPTPALGPTILPTPPASGDAEEIIREVCVTGRAIVTNPAGARFSAAAVPGKESRILMMYPRESAVELLGHCYLGWVKVRPLSAVSPGWMYAPDLELTEAATSANQGSTNPNDPNAPTPTADPLFSDGEPSAPDNQRADRPIQVVPLPAQAVAAPPALPRQALSVAVTIVDSQQQPRIGVRVQLIDVLGAVLREGQTDASGRITLVTDIPATAAVWVQVPAAGVTTMVDRTQPALMLVLP